MKKKIGVVIAVLLYAAIAVGIAVCIKMGGNYPTGADTMCHVYKGDSLYQSIGQGDIYPLYDRFWYNGVQMMRYWAPLPVYVLALCQMFVGGSALQGYLLYVAMIFFTGALVWLCLGIHNNRPVLGAFMGALWFFLPNNLFALFVEGNLPRSLSMVLLPVFMYLVYETMKDKDFRRLKWIILVFTGIALCHVGYAGMIFLAVLLFMLVYRLVTHEKGMYLPVLLSMLASFLIMGVWLFASLKGGITSTDSSQVMKGFFQDAFISLNPLRRLTRGNVEFYFGLAAFLLAVFGFIGSKRKSMAGFGAGVCIFLCTTTSAYGVLCKLPGSQYLWMLRFISIALCLILYSFLMWKELRRWIVILCCVLLTLDCIPSLSLVYQGTEGDDANKRMEQTMEGTLIKRAKSITKQRMALLDGSSLGAMAHYLIGDAGEEKTQETFGAGWQSAATAENIVSLNEAVERGFYPYVFDRALEMGNDTVLIQIQELKNKEKDIESVTKAAEELSYELDSQNDSYLLYHREVSGNFGTVTKYDGIAIGSSAALITYEYPDMEIGDSKYIDEYSYGDLSSYQIVYLAGFSYHSKSQAEALVRQLASAGIRVIINGDGVPVNEQTQIQEFLGVTCHSIFFENGYPVLYTEGGEVDTELFDRENTDWKTVYFNGLDQSYGYLYDAGMKVDFAGMAGDENIVFVGLNLTNHYFLTGDVSVGEYLQKLMAEKVKSLPDRQIVPLSIIVYKREIRIRTDQNDVNTTLAYQDIFSSEQTIKSSHHLLKVEAGTTTVVMKYPYMWQGLLMSLAGILLAVVLALWGRKKMKNGS